MRKNGTEDEDRKRKKEINKRIIERRKAERRRIKMKQGKREK